MNISLAQAAGNPTRRLVAALEVTAAALIVIAAVTLIYWRDGIFSPIEIGGAWWAVYCFAKTLVLGGLGFAAIGMIFRLRPVVIVLCVSFFVDGLLIVLACFVASKL
jgi:hypothetical protein